MTVQTFQTFDAILVRIFEQQTELMARYKDVEQLPDAPISLHAVHGQRVIKDFAWRTTEELTESYAELFKDPSDDRVRAAEELADATHFFVELLIFAGITPQQCLLRLDHWPVVKEVSNKDASEIGSSYWNVVQHIGIATNFLRNRPWKRTRIPTDEGRFRNALLGTYVALISLWSSLGFDSNQMLLFYEQKHTINNTRISEKY